MNFTVNYVVSRHVGSIVSVTSFTDAYREWHCVFIRVILMCVGFESALLQSSALTDVL